MTVATTSVRLRPKRSPSGPNVNAPSMAPSSAAENTGPSEARDSPSPSAMIGAATPMVWVSSPSKNATSEHRTMARIWNAPTRPSSIARVMLTISPP
jgi:hypothetical protein